MFQKKIWVRIGQQRNNTLSCPFLSLLATQGTLFCYLFYLHNPSRLSTVKAEQRSISYFKWYRLRNLPHTSLNFNGLIQQLFTVSRKKLGTRNVIYWVIWTSKEPFVEISTQYNGMEGAFGRYRNSESGAPLLHLKEERRLLVFMFASCEEDAREDRHLQSEIRPPSLSRAPNCLILGCLASWMLNTTPLLFSYSGYENQIIAVKWR